MYFRGIRGAITAENNTRTAILAATKELLLELIRANEIQVDDIASIFFSTTPDLNAEFPAKAARELGFVYTPLLCMNEISVPHSLSYCIRILMHVNTPKSQPMMRNVYLREAICLRPDQVGNGVS